VPDRPDGEPAAQPPASANPEDSSTGDSWGAPTGDEQKKSRPKAQPAYWDDKGFYRRVLGFLGLISLVSLAAVIWFHAIGKDSPDAVIAMGSAAVGALVSLVSAHGRQ